MYIPRRKESESSKRTEVIVTRVEPELKKKVESKAEEFGQRPSEFVRDQIERGVKRKTKWNKNKVADLVIAQEKMNRIIENLDSRQNELKEELIKYSEGVLSLWGF